jgi:hypothetical protein
MGRVYTASFAGLAITAQVDFIEILCGSADVILVHEIGISQLLDVGDASAEHLLLKYRQGLTGAGTAGTAQTPEPRQTGDPASDATVTTGRTTKARTVTLAAGRNRTSDHSSGFDHLFRLHHV